jgi:uncharacterized protein YggE
VEARGLGNSPDATCGASEEQVRMKTLHIAEPDGRARFAENRRRKSGLITLVACVAIALAMTTRALAAGPMNPAPLQPAQPQGARTIEVTGNGEAHVAPDVASLNLAIETHAATAQQSAGQNAALAQKVVDALTTKLQGKGKVWTGGYSLYPEYSDSSRPNDKPVVTGYRAENSITVETGEIGMLGGLIDTAIAAGANRINFLNFTLRDESQARSQAIALAAKDAQTQADSLARSLGVKLGPVVKATTEAENRPMPVMRAGAMAMSASMGAPTPVQPNEVTVPATVSITYQIE